MYRENAWLKYDQKELKNVMKFADGYKEFLSISKTERLATKEAVKQLEAAGFKCAKEVKSLKAGDKIYFVNKNKNVCAFIIGKKPFHLPYTVLFVKKTVLSLKLISAKMQKIQSLVLPTY